MLIWSKNGLSDFVDFPEYLGNKPPQRSRLKRLHHANYDTFTVVGTRTEALSHTPRTNITPQLQEF